MRTMVWLIILHFISGIVTAQYKDYPKLERLFNADKYDKCIKKAEKYAKKNRKELVPYAYLMKSWLKISEDPNHEAYKRAINKALSAARKIKRKDKEYVLFDRYVDDFIDLQLKALEKADNEVKEGKCTKAIRTYDYINEVFEDTKSAYKKSLCLLKSDFKKEEGFVLLRNTMLRTYYSFKKGKSYEEIPRGFAVLSKEYLNRNYLFNAEDILKKGVEVFPNDTAIRNEAVRQIGLKYETVIAADYTKDLLKLRNRLVWADSTFKNHLPITHMLKAVDRSLLTQYIKYEYSGTDKITRFIAKIEQQNPKQYTRDSINTFLLSLYRSQEIRRIDEAMQNLTQTLIKYNSNVSDGTGRGALHYVFDRAIDKKEYEVAGYYIQQAQKLYPQSKKMLQQMQQSLQNKLIKELEFLAENEQNETSIATAEKYVRIAPYSTQLKNLEKELYTSVLEEYKTQNSYSAFFSLVNKGLDRYPTNASLRGLKKEMVIKDFKENFVPNYSKEAPKMAVLCHAPSCLAGKVSDSANTKFITVLNYFRRQAGVYDSCFLDDELSEAAQDAALMMKAANKLNHSPNEKWKCYTKKGAKAAGSSNLSLGHSGTSALLGQMEDNGAGNGAVGHRRWVINPRNKVFGHGSNDNAMALYVFGRRFKDDPEKDKRPNWDSKQYISWPPKDFAPKTIVPQRWSFSLESADFGRAKISVTKKGKRVKIKPEKVQNGYAINTCVWQMKSEIKAGDVYKITIKNVKVLGSSKPKTFTYTIEILDL